MNKNVLLVGVMGGMGQATARKLLSDGYNVFGLDIKDKCDIENVNYYKCDITCESRILEVYHDISTKIDRLDAIISLSGVYVMDSLLEIDNERLKKIIDINSLGAYRIVKSFFNLLKQSSKVIIVSSEVAPLDPLPFNGVYSISKSLLFVNMTSLILWLDWELVLGNNEKVAKNDKNSNEDFLNIWIPLWFQCKKMRQECQIEKPKFVRKYCDMKSMIINAAKQFDLDVKTGKYPDENEIF